MIVMGNENIEIVVLFTVLVYLSITQHEYGDIVSWYEELAKDNSDFVKYVPSIGKSVEGRDQPAVHITTSTAADRKKIYFQCQIHASVLSKTVRLVVYFLKLIPDMDSLSLNAMIN